MCFSNTIIETLNQALFYYPASYNLISESSFYSHKEKKFTGSPPPLPQHHLLLLVCLCPELSGPGRLHVVPVSLPFNFS